MPSEKQPKFTPETTMTEASSMDGVDLAIQEAAQSTLPNLLTLLTDASWKQKVGLPSAPERGDFQATMDYMRAKGEHFSLIKHRFGQVLGRLEGSDRRAALTSEILGTIEDESSIWHIKELYSLATQFETTEEEKLSFIQTAMSRRLNLSRVRTKLVDTVKEYDQYLSKDKTGLDALLSLALLPEGLEKTVVVDVLSTPNAPERLAYLAKLGSSFSARESDNQAVATIVRHFDRIHELGLTPNDALSLFRFAIPSLLRHLKPENPDDTNLCLERASQLGVNNLLAISSSRELNRTQNREEVIALLDNAQELMADERYGSIEGIKSLGFLCTHKATITSPEVYGVAGKDLTQFDAIAYDVLHEGELPHSVAVVHPKKEFRTWRSISLETGGILYESGVIESAHQIDANTVVRRSDTGQYSAQTRSEGVHPAIAVNFVDSLDPMNELVVSQWKVKAIFYPKGCPSELVGQFRTLCDRILARGRVVPLYELDEETKATQEIYVPAAS